MKTFSHSKLSCFEQCPLKFKFNHVDKIETEIEETVEAFLGQRVHEVLERLYKDLKFQKLNSLEELLSFYDEEWKKNWNDGIIISCQSMRFVKRYHPLYSQFVSSGFQGLETPIFWHSVRMATSLS